jgi:hypothetical protein
MFVVAAVVSGAAQATRPVTEPASKCRTARAVPPKRRAVQRIENGVVSVNPQRMLRQKLEDLRRAGVTHVSAGLSEVVAAVAQPAKAEAVPKQPASRPSPAREPASRTPSPAAPQPRPAATPPALEPRREAAPPTSDYVSVRQFSQPSAALPPRFSADMSDAKRTCSSLSRSERETQLTSLAERVAACRRCQELADTRTQTVFGVGNPEAEIMFIGEAPGADEDRPLPSAGQPHSESRRSRQLPRVP